jgi:hypothetical protein
VLETEEEGLGKHFRHTQELHPMSISLVRPLKYLRSPPKPLKFLKLQFNLALKRLASAVQLRPWPPYFKGLKPNPGKSLSPLSAGTVASTAGTGAVVGGLSNGGKGALIGAGVGGAIGTAIAVLIRGNDLKLDAGTTLEIIIQRDVPLDASRVPMTTRAYSQP